MFRSFDLDKPIYGNGVAQAFTYDPVSRLSQLTNDLSGTANDLTATFAYNPASQITQTVRTGDTYAWTGHGNGSTSFTQNGLNQQITVGGSAASWDAKGNLTTEPQSGKTYGYSSENLLTSASGGVTLAYDPALRLYQVAGAATTRFAYDGVDAIAEYNGSNALQRRFVFGPGIDEPLVQYEGSGTTDRRFMSADERGSVISITSGSGTVLTINRYDEYGKPQSSNAGRFQYTGQKWIGEANLYDYKARDYLPHLGIFAQSDPIGQQDSPNLYAYVLDDPVNLVDPLGLTTDQTASSTSAINCIGWEWCGSMTITGSNPDAFNGLLQWALSTDLARQGDWGGGNIVVIGRRLKPDQPLPLPRRHQYVLPYRSPCPASLVFGYFKRAGHSAPGAPAAREGFTPRISLPPLLPGMSRNPISQYVNSSTGTIINTALPGHRYYPGRVTIEVAPLSTQTSTILITGEGTGPHAEENVIVGTSWFGATGAGAAAPEVCGK